MKILLNISIKLCKCLDMMSIYRAIKNDSNVVMCALWFLWLKFCRCLHLHMFNFKHTSISFGISGSVLRLNVKPACKCFQGQDLYSQSSWDKPVMCFHTDCSVFCMR